MTLACLNRVGRLLGSATLLALACAPARITDDGGTSTGSADDGGAMSSSSDGAGTGSSSGGTSTSSSGTDTLPPPPPCGVIRLSDVAAGIGGFALDGQAEDDHLGESVSGAGDVNGDGLADLIVGARQADPGDLKNSGRTYVVFGKADTDNASPADLAAGIGGFVLDGEAYQDSSGRPVSGAGDVNGDGVPDVLVAATGPDNASPCQPGRTYAVFGKSNTDAVRLADVRLGIGGFVVDEETEHDCSGRAVSGAGDVNGDGLADIIVAAPLADPNGVYSGRVYVVFGKVDTNEVWVADVAQGIGGFVLNGEAEQDEAGRSVSAAGDVNGDGLADVIVGVPSADATGPGSGRSYVVFGKADTDAVALADIAQGIGGFAVDGEAHSSNSGESVSGAGDVNGDGVADVIVGTSWGYTAGRAYVVFGKADTDKVSLADVAQGIGGFAMDGETTYDSAGRSVSGAGDVNGDGLADVVVGALGAASNGIPASGRTYVVFGKADTDDVPLADVAQGIGGFVLDGEAEYDLSSRSLSGAGDVNGDGFADVIVGAYLGDPNGLTNAGRAYVVFGGDFSCEGG